MGHVSRLDPWPFLREAVLDPLAPLLLPPPTLAVAPPIIAPVLQALSTILRQAPPPLAMKALAHTHDALLTAFPSSTSDKILEDPEVGSAYFDFLTRALALPLSLRHRGGEEEYGAVLTQTWHVSEASCPSLDHGQAGVDGGGQ